MNVVWGVVLIIFGALAWAGQALSWLAPRTAARWNLAEAEETVEPVYWADIRGEAVWDTLTVWPLVVAGVLLVADNSAWAYFGLIGGAIYVYFGGRGILTRIQMQQRGFRIGSPANVRLGLGMLGAWALVGLITVIAAVTDLN